MHVNGGLAGGQPDIRGAGGGRLLAKAGDDAADRVADLVVERLEDLSVELDNLVVLGGGDLEDEVIDGHSCGCEDGLES